VVADEENGPIALAGFGPQNRNQVVTPLLALEPDAIELDRLPELHASELRFHRVMFSSYPIAMTGSREDS
jgi:hypothetical protein